MRCRACNRDMRSFTRTVKDGDQEFKVEEDLCSNCRSSLFEVDSVLYDDFSQPGAAQFFDSIFQTGRKHSRAPGDGDWGN